MAEDAITHDEYARRLRARVVDSGAAPRALRAGALRAGALRPDAAELPEPYLALVGQIVRDSSRVTDQQVDAVLAGLRSQAKTFEVILAAAIGAGLDRWQVAEHVIREADDASA